ncbi:hypothetical protein [Rhodococcus erythropolis]|uniref:hypothetical protein n=1 Tax=Rhodococcus erythropolis TaxID=1833 RepID=UPI001BE84060|nr:hypothetical protein [Rhodococcus erythropolis]MBT2268958.1 hypothetical protein [Rhodococcus erythropolis]
MRQRRFAGEMVPQSFLDVLASLVDKSILIREEQTGAVRFRLLETLREYGLEKLQQSGEEPEMRRRHRDWYHQLLLTVEAEWIGPRQLEWIARLTREQSNLRETLEYCASDADDSDIETGLRIGAATYLFWSARGLHAEGRHWLDRLLALPNGRSTAPRIKSLCVNSTLAAVQGDVSAGSRLVAEARRLALERSESLTDAYVDHADGLLALFSGEHLHACSSFERALEVFRAEGELNRQVEALELLGVAYDLLNDLPGTIRNFEEVLEITRSRGESVYRSYSCWGMGVALWRQMDWSGATAFSGEGLRLAQRADEPLGAAVCIETLAWIASSIGKA